MRTFTTCALLLLIGISAEAQEAFLDQIQSASVTQGAIIRLDADPRVSTAVVFGMDRVIRRVSLSTLTEVEQISFAPATVTQLTMSASGQTVVAGIADGRLMSWNSGTKSPGKPISTHKGGVISMVMQDESMVFSAGMDNSVKVTDVLNGSSLGSVSVSPQEPTGILASPDGKQFAVLLNNGAIQFYSLAGLTPATRLKDNTSRITSAAYARDGRFLAAGTFDGLIYVWSMPAGTLAAKFTAHKGTVASVTIDDKSTWVVSASSDSTVHVADLAVLKTARTFKPSGGYWTQVRFTGDEALLAATSTGALQRWSIKKTPPDVEPPVVTILDPVPQLGGLPTRMYATEIGISGVVWDNKEVKHVILGKTELSLGPLLPTDTLPIPKGYSAKHFTTKARLDSIGLNPLNVTATDGLGNSGSATVPVERLSAADALEILAPVANTEVDGVSFVVQFRPWFDVSTYSMTVNLIDIVKGQRPKNKRPGDVISEEIPLVVGYNQVQLVVNGKNGERLSKTLGVSRKYTQTVVQAAPAAPKKREATSGPQRWAVVIGVSAYQNPAIPSLKYADKDAESFANFLRTPEGGGYDNDHMKVLLNKDATLPNVRDALINFLSGAIDMDLVVIYFAGHGAPEPARPQNLYLLTHDSDPGRLGTTAFPMWQIQDVLGRYINAKRIIVYSDACHSGGISVNFATRGVGVTEQNLVNQYLADLSRSKEGTVVFTASAAGEVSQEYPEFGHGVFTYYLLEGLRGKADYNNDYTITVNEAMQYTEEQVKRKTRGAQNPTRSQTAYDKEMTVAIIPH